MAYYADMKRTFLVLVIIVFGRDLFAERRQIEIGEPFVRGSILDIEKDSSGNPLILLHEWTGETALFRWNRVNGKREVQSFGKRNIYAIRVNSTEIRLFEAPLVIDSWILRIITPEDKLLLEISPPEIVALMREAGYPPEILEGYYSLTDDGQYLLAEFRLPDKNRIRRRTDYHNRQILIYDLSQGKVLFSRFFDTEKGFLGKVSPRFFPLWRLLHNSPDGVFLLSGPGTDVAVFKEGWKTPVLKKSFFPEPRFKFLDKERLLQWDHYARRCRIYHAESLEQLESYRFGLRHPVFSGDSQQIISLQDDGIHTYEITGNEVIFTGFLPFSERLTGCRYGYFLDKELFLFPSRYDEGILFWEHYPEVVKE